MRWRAGETVVLRDIWRGRVWAAKPLIVVADTPALTALWMMPGAVSKLPALADGTPVRIPVREWSFYDKTWRDGGALFLIPPGAAHAVWAMWSPGHTHVQSWYINLQEPLRRTRLGWDTMDQVLDITVAPDLTAWAWKDEQEFTEAVAAGVWSGGQACAIRSEGERAAARALAGAPPFRDGWERWTPDPMWPIPMLPVGWDVVE